MEAAAQDRAGWRQVIRGLCFTGSDKRPTAKELLRNRFIQRAKKTSYLVELIEKYKRWKLEHASDDGEHEDDSDKDSDLSDGDDSRQATVDWSWGTVRYRLGTSNDDDDDESNENDEQRSDVVSSPQPSDVQPPTLSTELQYEQNHVDIPPRLPPKTYKNERSENILSRLSSKPSPSLPADVNEAQTNNSQLSISNNEDITSDIQLEPESFPLPPQPSSLSSSSSSVLSPLINELQDRHCGDTESSPAFNELQSTLHRVGQSSPDIIESLVVDIIRAITGRVLSDSDIDSAVNTALRSLHVAVEVEPNRHL